MDRKHCCMAAVDSNEELEGRIEYFFKYVGISACVFLLSQNSPSLRSILDLS